VGGLEVTRYGIVVDVNKCVGCYNCFLTCRDEYAGNEYPGYSAAQPMSGGNWSKVIEVERGQYPHVKVNHITMRCMQCDSPGCMKAASGGAVYKRPDGIVIIDPVKAKGQKDIVNGCPYRLIEWNEELQLPQKCAFCAHLLDKGDPEPRCVESCPSVSLMFGDLDDPNSEVAKLVKSGAAVAMHPEHGLKEKVTYIGLPKKFVAGTVIYGDKDEVAGGLEITLSGAGKNQTMKTNGFGDFEFEGLEANTEYTVKIEAKGYKAANLKAKTSKDVYLGEIVLSK
jgi:Fe-S-cluster-containing dehydrogenase component